MKINFEKFVEAKKNGGAFKARPTLTAGGILNIQGYASTVDRDMDGEIILPSAFAETMDSYMEHPLVLFMHDWWSKPIGKVIEWKIDSQGLWVSIDILDTAEGKDIATLINAEILDSFSVGFGDSTRDEDDNNTITKLRLYEISVVNLGANPAALFEQAKQQELVLKTIQPNNKRKGKRTMPVPNQEALERIKKCEGLVDGFDDTLEAVKTQMSDLNKNIDKQKKLLKTVQEKQADLTKGLITEDDFQTSVEKIAEDIADVQKDIQTAKKAMKIRSGREPYREWKSRAKELNFVFNDEGQPLPIVDQKAYHLFQAPVDYEGDDGKRLKDIRDLHDAVLIADAYMQKKRRLPYNITQLKSYKLLVDLISDFDPEFSKAMYSTGTGVGDEWVPTEMSAQVYEEYELALNVVKHIPSWDMTSNPQTWPIRSSKPRMYRANEAATNSPSTLIKSDVGTSNITFTAETFAVAVAVSPEFIEDSIIAVVPYIRTSIGGAIANDTESWIINADDTTAGTHMDTAAAWATDTAYPEAYSKGLRKLAIAGSRTYNAQTTTSFTAADIRKVRSLLPAQYAHKSNDIVYVTTLATWIQILSFVEMAQFGTYAAGRTWGTGDLTAFDGSLLALTSNMVDTYAATGLKTGADALSALLCFNKSAFKVGSRRGVTIEFEKNITTQQWSFVGTHRKDFKSMDASGSEAVSYLINIAQA